MKRKMNFGIVLLITLLVCATVWGAALEEDATSFPVETVKAAVKRSANYLLRATQEDGMFAYRINMDPTVRVKKKYNILRHAGALYAMCMYHQLQPDDNMRAAIERAGRYLRYDAIGPVPGREDMLAVWSKPPVNQGGKPLQAKLGGTGLGLVALLSLEKIHPGFTPMADLKKLGRFIVSMQKEDGSFYSKYIPSLGGCPENWQSLYYPGEAALGLLMLYEKDPSDVWIESGAKALAFLAHNRKNKTDIPADHWALLATQKILILKYNDAYPISKELLINHARQICETIFREQIKDPGRPEYDGGFSMDGRTTPTATRLEGILAASCFFPKNQRIQKKIDSAVCRGLSFLLKAQIKEGKFAGAIPRAVGKVNGNTRDAKKFNRRVSEVRIDYVQHALSAMIQYLHLMR